MRETTFVYEFQGNVLKASCEDLPGVVVEAATREELGCRIRDAVRINWPATKEMPRKIGIRTKLGPDGAIMMAESERTPRRSSTPSLCR